MISKEYQSMIDAWPDSWFVQMRTREEAMEWGGNYWDELTKFKEHQLQQIQYQLQSETFMKKCPEEIKQSYVNYAVQLERQLKHEIYRPNQTHQQN